MDSLALKKCNFNAFASIRHQFRMHSFFDWTMAAFIWILPTNWNVIVSAESIQVGRRSETESNDCINEIFRFIFDGINHFLFKSFLLSLHWIEVKCILLTSILCDTIHEHLKLVVCCVRTFSRLKFVRETERSVSLCDRDSGGEEIKKNWEGENKNVDASELELTSIKWHAGHILFITFRKWIKISIVSKCS